MSMARVGAKPVVEAADDSDRADKDGQGGLGPGRLEQALERARTQGKAVEERIRDRQSPDQGENGPLRRFRGLLDHAQLVCWLITEAVYTVGEMAAAIATSTGVALYLMMPVVLMLQGKMDRSGAVGVVGLSVFGLIGGWSVHRSGERRTNKP